jgi:tetratricopeptide (TPR) repeat protein
LTPAVRDALVVGFDQANASQRPVFAAVLEVFGQEGKDERALGFPAFFTGEIRQAQGHLTEASAAYRRAARHFAAVAEHGWQAASLNNLGFLLRARGEYAEAEPYYREALALRRKLYPANKYPSRSASGSACSAARTRWPASRRRSASLGPAPGSSGRSASCNAEASDRPSGSPSRVTLRRPAATWRRYSSASRSWASRRSQG